MTYWQGFLLLLLSFLSFLFFLKGFYESSKKGNAYDVTYPLFLLGIFVWGDAVVFGLFWFIASLIVFFLHDWILFLLIFSIFWLVRSLGETIYWFNQQFSTIKRYPAEKLPGYRFFKNDSIWFIYQISMQCITVISIIFSIYFINLWLK